MSPLHVDKVRMKRSAKECVRNRTAHGMCEKQDCINGLFTHHRGMPVRQSAASVWAWAALSAPPPPPEQAGHGFSIQLVMLQFQVSADVSDSVISRTSGFAAACCAFVISPAASLYFAAATTGGRHTHTPLDVEQAEPVWQRTGDGGGRRRPEPTPWSAYSRRTAYERSHSSTCDWFDASAVSGHSSSARYCKSDGIRRHEAPVSPHFGLHHTQAFPQHRA